MFDVVRLIDVEAAAGDELAEALRAAAVHTGAASHLVAPTLPGVRNGGDLLLRLRYRDSDQWSSAAVLFEDILTGPGVGHVNGATYTGSPVSTTTRRATVYRALLLRVRPGTADHVMTRFEDELRLLPSYVPSIHTWQLSRVDTAVGTSTWTHVFEQEFADLKGLTGPYLMHPIHWAYVDRWFDPECPEAIVRDRVCHSYCSSPGGVLT
ncbi:Dabb family protein [Mycolicibacterium sp. P9-64]|uniref:Dabb family protein n=1 Tax=Mycolicibacterium sp. P9-64 TaxID=2024612 RepID=UPI0011F06347|nr:Dabb family protein [Mycolicibacterium sp. P9-64]KAA0084617.1 Dabb family protein [Mycolicibacterium sp. P9-64]